VRQLSVVLINQVLGMFPRHSSGTLEKGQGWFRSLTLQESDGFIHGSQTFVHGEIPLGMDTVLDVVLPDGLDPVGVERRVGPDSVVHIEDLLESDVVGLRGCEDCLSSQQQ
jgi:hypothetical protein